MSLGVSYDQDCPIARALDVVGERWTLLIIRDLFYGLRRYSDFRKHVGVSPAVLTQRLNRLVEEGVVARVPGPGAHEEYELTAKGEALWPVLCGLAQWGNENYMHDSTPQGLAHHQCGTPLDDTGLCSHCGVVPSARDVDMQVRPTARITEPHRLLEPLRL